MESATQNRSTGRAFILLTFAAGLVLVINPNGGQVPARLLGDLLFVGGAVCWAIYSLIGKAATTRFTPLRATLYATVSGPLLLLPFAVVERGRRPTRCPVCVPRAGCGSDLLGDRLGGAAHRTDGERRRPRPARVVAGAAETDPSGA